MLLEFHDSHTSGYPVVFSGTRSLFWQRTFDILKGLNSGSCMFKVFTVYQGEEGWVRRCGDP